MADSFFKAIAMLFFCPLLALKAERGFFMTGVITNAVGRHRARCRSPPSPICLRFRIFKNRLEELRLKNYYKSDYALNKKSESIVYRSDTGEIIEITKEAFLASDTELTEQDFLAWKARSDEMLRQTDRDDWRQTYKNVSVNGLEETAHCSTLPLDEEYMEIQDRFYAMQAIRQLLRSDSLTPTQRRRFRLYYFNGLTMRKIAELEGVYLNAVAGSLTAATDKLRRYFEKL